MIIANIWKNKNVPNHQPERNFGEWAILGIDHLNHPQPIIMRSSLCRHTRHQIETASLNVVGGEQSGKGECLGSVCGK